jgi:hypothetical protein
MARSMRRALMPAKTADADDEFVLAPCGARTAVAPSLGPEVA